MVPLQFVGGPRPDPAGQVYPWNRLVSGPQISDAFPNDEVTAVGQQLFVIH